MHVHEHLLLLGLDPAAEQPYTSIRPMFGIALGAACLTDLVMMGRIEIGAEQVVVRDTEATGSDALDAVLGELSSDARARETARCGRHLVAELKLSELCARGLVARGLLKHQRDSLLFIFHRHRFILEPSANLPNPSLALRALFGGEGSSDAVPAALRFALALAQPIGLLSLVAKAHDLPLTEDLNLADERVLGPLRILNEALAGTRFHASAQI